MHYNRRIIKSTNKTKATWQTINELLGKQYLPNGIQELIIDGTHFTDQNEIANLLDHYFSTAVDKLNHTTGN